MQYGKHCKPISSTSISELGKKEFPFIERGTNKARKKQTWGSRVKGPRNGTVDQRMFYPEERLSAAVA